MTTPHRKRASTIRLTAIQREHLRLQVRALAKRALKPSSPKWTQEMLTTAEIELLRQDLKASAAMALAAFRRKPLVGKPR